MNDPSSVQLFFLISHESTRYKLVQNIWDLTQTQIHFHYLVAKKMSDAIDEALKNTNQNSTTDDSMKIKGDESPDVLEAKLAMIKNLARSA